MIDPAVGLVAGAGALCLALSGPSGIVAAVLVIGGVLLGRRGRIVSDWTFAHLLALAAGGIVATTLGVVAGFALLLGWLAAHRAVVAEGASDQRVLLLLGALMALIGSVGTLSIGLAPILVVLTLATPVALLRVTGVREPGLERLAAAGTVALAATFFILVPRLQGGMLSAAGEPAAEDRFGDSVSLGDEQGDPDRDALVMRVRNYDRGGNALRGPLYLRGRALDHFDGRAWTRSGAVQRVAVGAWETRAEVLLEPLEGATVFGPPDLLYARSDQGPVLQGPEGELNHAHPGRRVSYEVFSRARPVDAVPDDRYDQLLQLPALDPRVSAVAAGLAPGSDDAREIVGAAVGMFARDFRYELEPPRPTGDPLTWFLLDSRAGHCEYFASALAVVLRVRGVPARLATGFYSAELTDAGYLAVRRGHAHAWVEVPVTGGWAVVDATPVGDIPAPRVSWWQSAAEEVNSAWLELVLDYDLDQQIDAAAALGGRLVAVPTNDPIRARGKAGMAGAGLIFGAVLLSGTVLRGVLWWLSRPASAVREADELVRTFGAARRRVVSRGWALPPSLPPVAAGEWLVAEAGDDGRPLLGLAWVLYRSRYGGAPVPRDEVRELVSALRRLPRRPADD